MFHDRITPNLIHLIRQHWETRTWTDLFVSHHRNLGFRAATEFYDDRRFDAKTVTSIKNAVNKKPPRKLNKQESFFKLISVPVAEWELWSIIAWIANAENHEREIIKAIVGK